MGPDSAPRSGYALILDVLVLLLNDYMCQLGRTLGTSPTQPGVLFSALAGAPAATLHGKEGPKHHCHVLVKARLDYCNLLYVEQPLEMI